MASGGVVEEEDAPLAFALPHPQEIGGRQKLGRGAGDEKGRRRAFAHCVQSRSAVAKLELEMAGRALQRRVEGSEIGWP